MKLINLLLFCFLPLLFSVYGQSKDGLISIKGVAKFVYSVTVLGLSTFDTCGHKTFWVFDNALVVLGRIGFVNQSDGS